MRADIRKAEVTETFDSMSVEFCATIIYVERKVLCVERKVLCVDYCNANTFVLLIMQLNYGQYLGDTYL